MYIRLEFPRAISGLELRLGLDSLDLRVDFKVRIHPGV